MKKAKFSLLALLAASCLASPSYAEDLVTGGGSTGGGNTVKGKLVEGYALPYSEWKGRELFEQKIEWMKKEFPALGKKLEEQKGKIVLYAIPVHEFKKLPFDKTGLPFDSEQSLEQEGNEIFWKDTAYYSAKNTEANAAQTYFHEAFMTMLEDKHSARVRMITTRIFEKNPYAPEIQNMLANSELGAHYSARQVAILRNDVKKTYSTSLGQAWRGELKKGDAPFPECTATTKLEVDGPLLTRANLEEDIREGSLADRKFKTTDPGSYQMYSEVITGIPLAWACKNHPEDFGPALCRETVAYTGAKIKAANAAKDATQKPNVDFKNPLNPERTKALIPGENEMRFVSVAAMEEELKTHALHDRMTMVEELANDNAYLTVLALNSGKDREPYEIADETSARLKKVFAKVKKRKAEIDRFSEGEKNKLLCNSAVAVTKSFLRKNGQATIPASDDPLEDKELPKPADEKATDVH